MERVYEILDSFSRTRFMMNRAPVSVLENNNSFVTSKFSEPKNENNLKCTEVFCETSYRELHPFHI